MRGFSRDLIPPLVLAGIEDARRAYARADAGWMWRAPEYWVTSSIARRLIQGLHAAHREIWLERSIKEVLSEAGATQRGRVPGVLARKGRFDIVVCQGNATPRCVIEVKSPVYAFTGRSAALPAKIKRDLDRLHAALRNGNGNSNITSGLLAFYVDRGEPSIGGSNAKALVAAEFGVDGEFHRAVKAWCPSGYRVNWHVDQKIRYVKGNGATMGGCIEILRG